MAWSTPVLGLPYESLFDSASRMHGIPDGMLSRMAWQESRYDPNAYNSSSGASGIMQIVPRWHPDVDPWNPSDAIPYAAKYLRENFDRFGTWELALAAYNAGPGNVAKYNGIPPFPETQDYVASIMQDVGPVNVAPDLASMAVFFGLLALRR